MPEGVEVKFINWNSILTSSPLSIIRRPVSVAHYHSSNRYGTVATNLNQRVVTSTFAGYWICKPSFSNARPSTSDLVILFLHGGGYVSGEPLMYTTLLLRIAEGVMAGGKTVSIFALEYSLAPEKTFPTQLLEVTSCYQYLLEDMGIASRNIAILGDSAGGSLAISFMVHLHKPLPGFEHSLGTKKPGKGIYLISPWVSLFNTTGYSEKAESDLLTSKCLNWWGRLVMANTPPEQVIIYTDFIQTLQQRGGWRDILPMKVWVSAGDDELFLHNIIAFVDQLKKSHMDSRLTIKLGEAHDWQLAQSISAEKQHLSEKLGNLEGAYLSGADEIGDELLAVLN